MSNRICFWASMFRPPDEVGEVILQDWAKVLGSEGPHTGRREVGRTTFQLAVPIGPRGRISWPAWVQIRTEQAGEDRWQFTVEVAPVGSTHRFPTFHGTLTVTAAGQGESLVTLAGSYHLPLGVLGAVSGVLGGHRLARASLRSLFGSLLDGIRRQLLARPAPLSIP